MKEVFKDLEHRVYGYRDSDISRDTGVSVDFRSGGGGGCDGPGEHKWTVANPDGTSTTTPVPSDKLPMIHGATVNSDGSRVVGQFRLDRAAWRDWRFRWSAERRGLLDADRPGGDQLSDYYLVAVPTEDSFLTAPLRRKGYLPQKVLARLPEEAESFDMAPDGSIAVAQGHRVLRYGSWTGLAPWLEFDTEVREVEYLSDGHLAIATRRREGRPGCDYHLLAPDGKKPVEFSLREVYPDEYLRLLNHEVSGVEFLAEEATAEQKEQFLANQAWLHPPEQRYWKPHVSVASPGGSKAAVVTWEGHQDAAPALWLYDRQTSQAESPGPVWHPDSRRSGLSYRQQPDLSWSSDGRFLVFQSQPRTQGAPVDLTVWDLQSSTCCLVPGVRQVKLDVDRAEVAFLAPGNVRETVPLDLAPALKDRRWYKEARIHDLFGSDSVFGDDGIEVTEHEVKVGSVSLPRRQLKAD